MLLLLCSGLCLFLSMGFGFGVFFVALPLLFLRFPVVVMAILEFIMSFSHFYWDIFIFILRLLFEIGAGVLHVLSNALPIIIHGWTELCRTIVDIFTYLRYHLFPSFADFFSLQRDVFLLFWGFIVTSVYTIYNLFATGDGVHQQGRHRNNIHRNHRNHNRNHHNEFMVDHHHRDDFDERNDDLDANVRGEERNDFNGDNLGDVDFNDNRNGARFAGGIDVDGPRHRHREQTDRQDNPMRVDGERHGIQTHRRDGRMFEEEQCVVCFERDRNAAMFPCGHTQTCLTCTRNIMGLNKKCPICQRRITEYRQVFL